MLQPGLNEAVEHRESAVHSFKQSKNLPAIYVGKYLHGLGFELKANCELHAALVDIKS